MVFGRGAVDLALTRSHPIFSPELVAVSATSFLGGEGECVVVWGDGMSDNKDHSGQSNEVGPTELHGIPTSLAGLIRRADERDEMPPVERWNPVFCGDLDIRIASDGAWYYLGSPIGRSALVRLFASVLRKDDDGKTYLVTPVEKIGVVVEDAPFQAVEMAEDGALADDGCLIFRTNLGDLVRLDQDHPMRFELEADTAGLKAYILVRGRLEARLTRALMYDLVTLAGEGTGVHAGQFGITSGGTFTPICSMDALGQFEVPV